MFVAINLILDKDTIINSFPLIYSSLEDDISIESEFSGNEDLKNYIKSKIHFSKYNNVKLNYSFIAADESAYEGSIDLYKLFNIVDLYGYEEFVKDELKYLYKCVFKKDLQTINPKYVYNTIYTKYPNRVNLDVVTNYIKSSIKDKYPTLKYEDIEQIGKIFKNELS